MRCPAEKSPAFPFVNLPLGSFSRAAYTPAGARLLGVFLFLLTADLPKNPKYKSRLKKPTFVATNM